jgi:Flp pilus assembly protein TadB
VRARDTNDPPSGLSPYERHVLTTVEAALRREDPELERTLSGRRHWFPSFALAVPACLGCVVAGVVLMVVGLVVQLVLLAFGGFVAVLFGVTHLLENRSIVPWTRELLGLDPPNR